MIIQDIQNCERFEPRSHFKSRLSLTVRVNVVLNRTVGKIPFLDCLVTRDNNKLKTTIYGKPTHTDRLLDQSSYNPTSHKATTIRTLTRQTQLVCDSPDSLQDETDYLNNVLIRTITTWTLLDGTLTVTVIPTLRPTLALLQQRLYCTSEAPLKLLHVYYNLTTYALRTNR